MYSIIPFPVSELAAMKRYPDNLYYRGRAELLNRPKISIVGTRRPNPYTRAMTYEISKNVTSNKKRDCTIKNETGDM